jgi:hypothetical protein
MKDNQTIAQFLNVKEFPFFIKDKNGKIIYFEYSTGRWSKSEYDSKGNVIRHENSTGFWFKREYDSDANAIRYENSDGYWYKREYDSNGNIIRLENSSGVIIDNRPKPIIELTLEDVAKLKGVSVSQIRIKE